jgi:hypothetical protein
MELLIDFLISEVMVKASMVRDLLAGSSLLAVNSQSSTPDPVFLHRADGRPREETAKTQH